MRLPDIPTLQNLQDTLHAKAKRSRTHRFSALYEKIYRQDVLLTAYRRCLPWLSVEGTDCPEDAVRRALERGYLGVDRQTFADIEDYGVQQWLDELAEDLRKQTYRPDAIARSSVPLSHGRSQRLAILTIKDRVAQSAALLILEPIFESELNPEQYAYRPGRGEFDAIAYVELLLPRHNTDYTVANLNRYFDSIPHAEVMALVARRVKDKHVLNLLQMWLEMPLEWTDVGNRPRTTLNKDMEQGIPQSAPISRLLSNLYMRRLVLGWRRE